jgi:hypothetical protein
MLKRNIQVLANWNLLLQHFLAPGALSAFGANKVACKSCVHSHHYFLIGRHKFVAAVFTLIRSDADLKLYRVKAGNQKYYANSKNRNELPGTFGYQKRLKKYTRK